MDESLYIAAISGEVQILHNRLNEDANILDRVMRECSGQDNLLHLGALFGHVDLVEMILDLKPEFAHELNSKGQSPLHLAAERGHLQVVKVLLATDADVCFVRDQDGMIPLHLAVIKGRVKVVEELVNTKYITAWFLTNEKEPILHLCAKHDQFDTFKRLVTLANNDGFVRLKDSNDNTILHILSAKKRGQMIRLLFYHTNIVEEINALNVHMLTALDELYLVQWEEGFSRLRQILVEKGAKRSTDLLGRRTNFSLKLPKQDSKWLKRMEPSFLVLAVLVVTVTYQAVLNPPGGFWGDDYPDPGSNQNHTASKQNHRAGKSILLSKDRLPYYAFYTLNSMVFFPSLAIIGIIVRKHEVDPTYMLKVLTSITGIVTLSLTVAYFFPLWLGGASWRVCVVFVVATLAIHFLVLHGPYIKYLLIRGHFIGTTMLLPIRYIPNSTPPVPRSHVITIPMEPPATARSLDQAV